MGKVFLISDTHFDHHNIIEYEKRPFNDVVEMNEYIISNWNRVVKNTDKVFMLGDFALGNRERVIELIRELNGFKSIILGNHDKYPESFWLEAGMKEASKYPIIYKDKWIFSHRPLAMSNDMPYINIHGHIHSKKLDSDKHFNVSVECIDYTPIQLLDIEKILKEKSNL